MRIALITLLSVFACQPAAAGVNPTLDADTEVKGLVPGWNCYVAAIKKDETEALIYCVKIKEEEL